MNGILNNGATRALNMYASFQAALVGLYAQALDHREPTSMQVRATMTAGAIRAQSAFLTGTSAIIESVTENLIDDALRAAGLDPQVYRQQLREIATESRASVLANLMLVSQRDADTVSKRLRDFAFAVDSLVNGANVSYSAAVIKTKIAQGSAFTFEQIDRANRRWKGTDYVRTAARGHFVSIWVESFLFGVLRHGEDLARVVAPGSDYDGLIFSISGADGEHPSYEAIKGDVWHPNSSATAERVEHVPS